MGEGVTTGSWKKTVISSSPAERRVDSTSTRLCTGGSTSETSSLVKKLSS